MKCCMRSLSPSKAADMLANMVSPPIAGTSLATRIVAFGGSLRNVSSECQTSVRNGGLVSSLRNLISTETSLSLRRERMHGQFAEPAAEVDQVLRADVLVAEDQQLVLGERVLDGVAHLVGHRLAKIDAGDLGAEVGADPRDRDTGMLRDDGTALEAVDGLIHDAILPVARPGTPVGGVCVQIDAAKTCHHHSKFWRVPKSASVGSLFFKKRWCVVARPSCNGPPLRSAARARPSA